jgi:hypothetical protein
MIPEVLESFSPLQIDLFIEIGSRLIDGLSEKEIQTELGVDGVLWMRYLTLMRREFAMPHNTTGGTE